MNEHGNRSRCEMVNNTTIRALDWQGGLLGVLTPDRRRIDWANGTSWSR